MAESVSSGVPAVEVKDVWFAYDREPVIEAADFTIEQGDFVSVVGPNGGGKTTILKLILGLLRADRGRIRVLGQSPDRVRRLVGYTPQNALHDLQFPITVMEVVLLGRLGERLGGPYTREDRREAETALAEVGVLDLARRGYAELSGGQRQRVLIARTLCSQPKLLLMDEPTANVDTQAEESLIHLLGDLNQRMTIVLVSHDLAFVAKAVKSAICVNRQVAVHATAELTSEAVRGIYGDQVRVVRHDHCLDEEDKH